MSVVSRTFGLRPDKVVNGLSGRDNEGFIQDLRGNGSVNLSVMQRPFAQLRNSTVQSAYLSEGSSRLNFNSGLNYRSNYVPFAVNPFGARERSRGVAAGSIVEENGKFGEDVIDEGGFRRPTLSRVIRGRNSLLSSRLFHNQTTDRHCRDLSNINGFNVSHISRRGGDAMSESRLPLRSNWMDNQSMTGSMMSSASMKAQFMNLLENLHHSILNIGPNMTAEAVRMEFDKAKQGLESISEMSFAPSIREPDAASIISHSSKYICKSVKGPAINEIATENVIDGGSFLLKSSSEVLKTLVTTKTSHKNESTSSLLPGRRGRRNVESRESSRSRDSDDEEVAEFLFKKPLPVTKRKQGRKAKTKPSEPEKSSPNAGKKALSLKQWYPVALGSDLVFCGVNEEGVNVKTDPVKKRLNGRKVQLVSGLICNLVGSPSLMVSALPKKISLSLVNGLTERWRVLQNELLNCQTTGDSRQKRKSKSPKVISSPRKTPNGKLTKTPKKSPKATCVPKKLNLGTPAARGKAGRKSKSPKARTSPSKSRKGTEVLTRSGRTVKPPSMFWLVSRNGEMNTLLTSGTPETTSEKTKRKKNVKPTVGGTSARKAATESPKKQAGREEKEPETKEVKRSPGRPRKVNVESNRGGGKGKLSKAKSPKNQKKEVGEEEGVRVHSSTEEAKRQSRTLQSHRKRKREVTGDVDSVQAKKSKIEKKVEVEVESTVADIGQATKKRKKPNHPKGDRKRELEISPQQRKSGIALSAPSPKSKAKKSPGKKMKKKPGREAEAERRKEENEFEEDFESKLDDIEIPEIANVSGNPQLSRSQLRLVIMETPPLKYFNNNLKLLGSATPMRSPDWCISQRTESEVKRFQKRREGALKKKAVNVKKTIVSEKTTKTVESRDLKEVMEWVAEKTVRSPAWNSKVLQYVIPSRRQREQREYEEDEEEEEETEFSRTSFA